MIGPPRAVRGPSIEIGPCHSDRPSPQPPWPPTLPTHNFFNESSTWDYNGDGFINDPLTHVGIVERQEPDGTVIFISRVAGAIERYRMNLALPQVHKTAEGRILNDYIRRKDIVDPPSTGYLAGQLFAGFGTRIGL